MAWTRWVACAILCFAGSAVSLRAQNAADTGASAAPVQLTFRRCIELALQNSKDIQLAKIHARVADDSAHLSKSEFHPNLYAGSGAGYTYGLPETPGGRPPSIFSLTYTEQVFNGPLRGLAKEQEEQAKAQRVVLEDTRNWVIERVATAYLELVKVKHSLELLRKEKDSSEKIVEVTQQRQGEGFELASEVTKAQLTKAQVVRRILQLEGRQDELEVFLRDQLGFAADQPFDVTPEELPGSAEQAGANLVALAAEGNTSLAFAQSDVRAKEFRLAGEKKGYWPTLELVTIYSVLEKYSFRNYSTIYNNFTYNNLNAGVNINLPIFSAKTRANVSLAQANLDAAKLNLAAKRNQVSAEVRQRSRKVQETDAAKEVARLELQLAQQTLAVVQSQFSEGKTSLRDVERARLEENEKWMAYLDANFQRQQAQLELLRTAGQLAKVLE
ncbi:MAG TPA: TolC family protein [Candidatus Limnocylindrales bacterium]|nr:TolC family protein [Candidatus Limnocylindrales bacterium]